MLEPILAFLHISAFVAWIVFATAMGVLCRHEAIATGALPRLVRMDRNLWLAAVFVLLTGLARTWWGHKGFGWYWSNPLLHLKVTLFVVAMLMLFGPGRKFRRWQDALQTTGSVPSQAEVRGPRRLILIATHVVAIIPLPAVFLARGWL